MASVTVFVDDAASGRFPPVRRTLWIGAVGTLAAVAPEFSQAVRARQSRSDQPYPAP